MPNLYPDLNPPRPRKRKHKFLFILGAIIGVVIIYNLGNSAYTEYVLRPQLNDTIRQSDQKIGESLGIETTTDTAPAPDCYNAENGPFTPAGGGTPWCKLSTKRHGNLDAQPTLEKLGRLDSALQGGGWAAEPASSSTPNIIRADLALLRYSKKVHGSPCGIHITFTVYASIGAMNYEVTCSYVN